jgi:hypothetical protein
VDAISGTVPKSLHFSSTSVCDSLAPATYSAAVRLKVSTYGDLTINLVCSSPTRRPSCRLLKDRCRRGPWGSLCP